MIEEEGTVVEIKGGAAIIKAQRTTSCESCMSKDLCHSVTETDMVVEADNPAGAHVGDRVVFTVGAATLLKAGVLFYLFPLLGFIAGIVLGQVLAPAVSSGLNPDLLSAVLGSLLLVLTLLALRLYGRRAEKNRAFRPRVVRVV
jgi:sigma-E factor negative regulatory protein RseC